MNVRCSLALITLCASITFGCGDSNDPPKTPPPSKSQGTVLDGMISQKERAKKGVDDAMEKNRLKLEEAMKKNERPESAE